MSTQNRSLPFLVAIGLLLTGCGSADRSQDGDGQTLSPSLTTGPVPGPPGWTVDPTASDTAAPEGVPADPTSAGTSVPGGTPTGAPSGGSTGSSPTSSDTGAPAPGPSWTPGDVHRTEAPANERTATGAVGGPAVPLSRGVSARVVGHRALRVTARGPGEVSGDGVAVVVQITNGGPAPLDLAGVLVDVRDSAGAPAQPVTTTPAEPVRGRLAPGRSIDGTYVFVMPQNTRKGSTVLVRASADAVVRLEGDL